MNKNGGFHKASARARHVLSILLHFSISRKLVIFFTFSLALIGVFVFLSASLSRQSLARLEVLETVAQNTYYDSSSEVESLALADPENAETEEDENLASEELIGSFLFAKAIVQQTSPSVSSFVSNLSNNNRDAYRDAQVVFTSGVLRGQARAVSAYDGITRQITVEPSFNTVPSFGDSFNLISQELVYSITTSSNPEDRVQLDATQAATISSEYDNLMQELDAISAGAMADSISNEQLALFENSLQKISERVLELYQAVNLTQVNSIVYQDLLHDASSTLRTQIELKEKVIDIRTALFLLNDLASSNLITPVIESYLTQGETTDLNFVAANPINTSQSIIFQAYLPREISADNIYSLDDFDLFFDRYLNQYFIGGVIELGPGEIVNRTVKIEDVWFFNENDLNLIKERAQALAENLAGSRYESQAIILSGNVLISADLIAAHQRQAVYSPLEQIHVYRENLALYEAAYSELNQISEFVITTAESRLKEKTVSILQLTMVLILSLAFSLVVLAFLYVYFISGRAKVVKKKSKTAVKSKSKSKKSKQAQKDHWWQRLVRGKSWTSILGRALITIMSLTVIALVVASFWYVRAAVVREKGMLQELIELEQEALGGTEREVAEMNTDGDTDGETDGVTDQTRIEDAQDVEDADNAIGGEPLLPLEDEEVVEDEEMANTLSITETPTGTLNVRNAPGLYGEKIGQVLPGEEYEYLEENNGWYKIRLVDGGEGWVFGDYINLVP